VRLPRRVECLEQVEPEGDVTPWPAEDYHRFANDPLGLAASHWPGVRFYDKQVEILESVRDNDETFVTSAHQLGKDFVCSFAGLHFFLTRHPVRVVITSVRDDHMRVFFGELGRFIDTCKYPLSHKKGGPLIINHREIKKIVNGEVCKISYLIGTVSEKGEGMAGHHAAHTLFIADEASGIEDMVFERAATWAKRSLVFGNPYGNSGFFFRAVKGGDIPA